MNKEFALIAVFNDPEKNIRGNISSVVITEKPMPEKEMQFLAADFNQPATTYLWSEGAPNHFSVRWFAPDAEIDLCGHGTMAAIAFLSEKYPDQKDFRLSYSKNKISGNANKDGTHTIILDPVPVLKEKEIPGLLKKGLGITIKNYFLTNNKDILLVEREDDLKRMNPDFNILRQLETFGYAVTAPGNDVDFVSRTLVPHVQQLEDHATGSSHAALTPFWSERLNKSKMTAHQLSKRGGAFICELKENKVHLSGKSTVIARGRLV